MILAVECISGLMAVLSYGRGPWWLVGRDLNDLESGLFCGRAHWHDLLGRPHVRLVHSCTSMVEAAEALEWQLRQDVAHMHDFEDPEVRA